MERVNLNLNVAWNNAPRDFLRAFHADESKSPSKRALNRRDASLMTFSEMSVSIEINFARAALLDVGQIFD